MSRSARASSTTERLFERYNTLTRRRTAHDPRYREMIFKSFARVFGPFLPPDANAAVLDAGCGEGSFLTFLRRRGYRNLAGFDLSEENVAICNREGLGFVHRFDALEIDRLPGETRFERIFALDLVEHLPKEKASVFLELARDRLAPGGLLVVQTPNMGCIYGQYYRYYDLSHEFGLTEKSARDLFMTAGFADGDVRVSPAWNATTRLGHAREAYARLLHYAVFLADDSSRPRIPTKNLLITARR
ncbi:MAG: class I SAM-dependent methyltransferase [Actinomycetota bacterium]|nr:class I SAM-dependent methyltransferase [Actinomycetota bacterium]